MDFSDPKSVESQANEKLEGKFDIIIHNAGLSQREPFLTAKPELNEKLLNVDFLSVVALTQTLLPRINQGGVICGIGSMASVSGAGCRSYYSGIKSGLNAFLRVLGYELKGRNIHCMTVNPGYVKTNVSANSLVGDGSSSFGKTDLNIMNGMSVEQHSKIVAEAIYF